MRRNHHYVLKQVSPNLANGMYPSSFYSSSNPRYDSHWHYRDKSVPDNSPALSITTPTAILKYPYPIWIRMEFTAGIYNRCLVSSWQHGMISAPAGNDKEERGITSHKCTIDYVHTFVFSDFLYNRWASSAVDHIKCH